MWRAVPLSTVIPVYDRLTWRFRVIGRPGTVAIYRLEDLWALPGLSLTDSRLSGSPNTAGTQWWATPIIQLVPRATIHPQATSVRLVDALGESIDIPLNKFFSERTHILTLGNNQPISPDHGGPCIIYGQRGASIVVRPWIQHLEIL